MRQTLLLLALAVSSCVHGRPPPTSFAPIAEFSDATNAALRSLFSSASKDPGRKVAVFDADGTIIGQVPHYLADECILLDVQAHNRRPELIGRDGSSSDTSVPNGLRRLFYLEGLPVEEVRAMGEACFREYYSDKIYPPMRSLITELVRHGFEVFVITASPEALYQGFLSRELGIPMTHVLGTKVILSQGRLTRTLVEPIPKNAGKRQVIETFVQAQPLLVAGNSSPDREMIDYSRGVKLVINPDTASVKDLPEGLEAYAKREGWLIEHVRDVEKPGFPNLSSRIYGIPKNQARP